MPNLTLPGELVPVVIHYFDDRGWTDQEGPYSERMRRTWKLEIGKTYYRVQSIGNGTVKIFPSVVNDVDGYQSVVNKDLNTGFPAVFYYKNPE